MSDSDLSGVVLTRGQVKWDFDKDNNYNITFYKGLIFTRARQMLPYIEILDGYIMQIDCNGTYKHTTLGRIRMWQGEYQ